MAARSNSPAKNEPSPERKKREMKRTTLKTRLWVLAATLLLLISLLALPVSAANTNVAAPGGEFTFKKYLVMDENANVPNVSFSFSIAPGDAVDATESGQAIYAGNDSHVTGSPLFTVNSVTFSPTDKTWDSKQNDDTVTLESNQKYAKKTLTLDFKRVSFSAPGIYRWVITESRAEPKPSGIDYDNSYERTLDVFVKYSDTNENQLEVSDYILYNSKKTDGNSDAGSKDDGFTNTYTTYDLTLTKNVTGNQGDRDKFFKFTVVISNAVPGTVYDVTLPSEGPDQTDLTDNEVLTGDGQNVNLDKLTVGSAQEPATTGSVTATYYLKHNQSIVIKGLTADTKYTITETDYSSDGYTTTNTDDDTDGKTTTTKDMGTADHTVTFTNHKQGTVPTGILLETAPYLILGAVVVAGLVVLFATRRRRTRE